MNSRQNQMIAAIGALGLSILSVVSFWLSQWTRGVLLTSVVGWLEAIGAVVWGITLWYAVLRRQEVEQEELKKAYEAQKSTGSGKSLFSLTDEEYGETYSAGARRKRFEKFLIPGGALIVAIILGIGCFILIKQWQKLVLPLTAYSNYAAACFFTGGLAFVAFIFGRYAGGIAAMKGNRFLSAGMSFTIGAAVFNFITALTLATAHFGYDQILYWVTISLIAILGILGAEVLLNFVLDFYRPRVAAYESRWAMESRVLGIFGGSGGIAKSASAAIDYQFGFKVSETWFYQFLLRKILWLILIQVTLFYALTSMTIIGPQEQAIIERFGKPREGQAVLESGFHFKLPWPFERVYRYPTKELQSITVGVERNEDEWLILWTRKHNESEFNLLVASDEALDADHSSQNVVGGQTNQQTTVPVNVLTASVHVQYDIQDLTKFALRAVQPQRVIKAVAVRELSRHAASADFFRFMGTGRFDSAAELKANIQRALNEADMGVEVTFVGLQDVHPPVAVGEAFESVIAAFEEKESKILAAERYANETLPTAIAKAFDMTNQASVYLAQKKTLSEAEAKRFQYQNHAYRAAPNVYRWYQQLAAMERGLRDSRKYIILTPGGWDEVLQLNYEDKVRPDLLSAEIKPKEAN